MNIFVAGAAGAIGKRLVPMLVAGGHRVIGTTRHAAKAYTLLSMEAEPVVADALDRETITKAVLAARPDVVVHQATSLATMRSFRNFDREFELTNRLRTEGTRNLIEASRAAGVKRFVAQSYSGWPNERTGGRVKTEDDPLDPNPPKPMGATLDAIRQLEEMVVGAADLNGIVLRYGSFYGPGTSVAPGGDVVEAVRQRKFPIIGNGAGVWSWIHIDDAAQATHLAIERGPAGVYNIVDDEPAEVSAWLPDLAQATGANPPYHVPEWLGGLLAGETIVLMMTTARGSSNAKAKRVLGWQLNYASWREGFRHGLETRLLAHQV